MEFPKNLQPPSSSSFSSSYIPSHRTQLHPRMISLYSSSSLSHPNPNPKPHTNTKCLLFLLVFIFFTAPFLFYLFSTHNHNSQSRISFLSNICICSVSPLEGHPQASPLPPPPPVFTHSMVASNANEQVARGDVTFMY
ncbi:hypothetical protein VNO77_41520 [Canavalia gladiata]|uniref:Uncharacterized protein n=1 Tax=Canavalia gladiata TaxID=3824 RepID=A0AAN9PRX8_CANGL